MQYRLYSDHPESRYIEVECSMKITPAELLEIQLPAWRPGRYELQNFAKNIQQFGVFDTEGNALSFRKITKDRWLVQTREVSDIIVRYNYYSNVLNAGSSYVSDEFWYVNPVNLCVYTDENLDKPCTLELVIPDDYLIACGLPQQPQPGATGSKILMAKDYYELVDSPLIASATIQCRTYQVDTTIFHVWMQGNIKPDWQRILADFQKFTAAQVKTMGGFPESKYHFLNLILPTPYYHGVEHRHSTMIVLGPDDEGEGLYTDLLGVSSHELYHAWNIIRIRPKELLPYDFTKENYFSTCFVAEGVTTYYGDLYLRRSGVFDDTAYFRELQVYMKRHFENNRDAQQSLTESSWDLWLDGYEKGIPRRKVSVYHKGALAALVLDITIRRNHEHKKSLDDVMRLMWQRFGIPFVGYSFEDYQAVVEEVAGEPLEWYWKDCILSNTPLENHLNHALSWVGLQMVTFSDGTVHLQELENERAVLQRNKWLNDDC
ncbi:M61 family metallopeptidase [Runella slithyformis]|uniref:Peptidase M61 domain protein n=1 Tax=Runella slithyformis (strain ATCC 29530 / DSM 19594 / LMG 11500 / NCIMB 11436 / LSU 4) TaxID=761193 RepID=A0A7U3ZKA4_RUNSL|nr:M61 family metallopeptidase [Runella slithyformis]AEI48792.1 peptidase M61 domain protein [Runella slithyformis DSM 19594]